MCKMMFVQMAALQDLFKALLQSCYKTITIHLSRKRQKHVLNAVYTNHKILQCHAQN